MASEKSLSYADIAFAIVLDAPPTLKNCLTVSCPAPISAKVPYTEESKLMVSAFCFGVSLCSNNDIFEIFVNLPKFNQP